MDSLGKGLESLIPDKEPGGIPANLDSGESNAVLPSIDEKPRAPLLNLGVSSSARTYNDHFIPRRGESIFLIEISKIEPNPFQPRREFDEDALRGLASSIREHGVLQPVLVTKQETETPSGPLVITNIPSISPSINLKISASFL